MAFNEIYVIFLYYIDIILYDIYMILCYNENIEEFMLSVHQVIMIITL